jgi:hypothetical protein
MLTRETALRSLLNIFAVTNLVALAQTRIIRTGMVNYACVLFDK